MSPILSLIIGLLLLIVILFIIIIIYKTPNTNEDIDNELETAEMTDEIIEAMDVKKAQMEVRERQKERRKTMSVQPIPGISPKSWWRVLGLFLLAFFCGGIALVLNSGISILFIAMGHFFFFLFIWEIGKYKNGTMSRRRARTIFIFLFFLTWMGIGGADVHMRELYYLRNNPKYNQEKVEQSISMAEAEQTLSGIFFFFYLIGSINPNIMLATLPKYTVIVKTK